MMRIKHFLLVVILVLKMSGFAMQSKDSSRTFFPNSYGEKKWKPIVGFDAFRSFYSGAPVKFNGIRFGAEFKGVHRFGFGFYGLKRDLYFNNLEVQHPQATDTSLVKFQLNYSAFFYERVFYKTKKWEISFPIYLGGGGLNGYVEGSDRLFYKYLATSFSLLNTGITAKYYLLPWLAPKIGTGFRFTFNAEKNLRKAFNGPYYSFGLNILIGELYRTIFPQSK
jgi:hypothetical protein